MKYAVRPIRRCNPQSIRKHPKHKQTSRTISKQSGMPEQKELSTRHLVDDPRIEDLSDAMVSSDTSESSMPTGNICVELSWGEETATLYLDYMQYMPIFGTIVLTGDNVIIPDWVDPDNKRTHAVVKPTAFCQIPEIQDGASGILASVEYEDGGVIIAIETRIYNTPASIFAPIFLDGPGWKEWY